MFKRNATYVHVGQRDLPSSFLHMLLGLFILFNCIALALFVTGLISGFSILKLGAFTLMFLTGFPFLFGSGIEYQTGSTTVTINGTATETYAYASYTNHVMAFFYQMLSIIGFVGVMFLDGGRRDDDE